MAKILNSIVEATGQTPLVKLNRLDEGLPGCSRLPRHPDHAGDHVC